MDSIKRSFIRMSILSPPKETKPLIKLRNICFGIHHFTAQVFSSAVGGYFLFYENGLEKALTAIMPLTAYAGAAYIIAVGYIKHRSFQKLFDDIAAIESERNLKNYFLM